MRNMGGLARRMKLTFAVYLVGSLALAGIVPLAGFWSKDEILAEAQLLQPAVYWLLTIAAFFTAFYMGRQVWMVFFGAARSEPAAHAQESPAVMTIPLVVLALLAAFGGALNLPGLHTFTGWLEHTLEGIHPGEFNPVVAGTSTALAVIAILLAGFVYGRLYPARLKVTDDPLRPLLGLVFTGMEKKWGIDELYQRLIVRPFTATADFLSIVMDSHFYHDWFHEKVLSQPYRLLTQELSVEVDLGIIDHSATSLAAGIARGVASRLRLVQTGFVRNYALIVLLGVVVILGYLIIR
jgi:NADH-quinone oxidoreductase subunit L